MLTIDEANNILINGDGILMVHLDSRLLEIKNTNHLFDKLAKMAIIIIVTNGSALIEIDFKKYQIDTKDNNIIIIGKFNRVGSITIKENFNAYCLILSRKFISRIIPYRVPDQRNPQFDIPITNFIAMRDNPVLHFEKDDWQMMIKLLDKVQSNIQRTSAILRIPLLYVSVVAFLIEMMNIIIPNYVGNIKPKDKDRKRELVQDFSNILFQNFRKEHSVTYYADKLCVSAQYLSKATHYVLGVSASRVISDMINTEASIMLRTPKKSIEQISLELGFSNQSSFGKFFKKLNGVSPLSYRKKS